MDIYVFTSHVMGGSKMPKNCTFFLLVFLPEAFLSQRLSLEFNHQELQVSIKKSLP